MGHYACDMRPEWFGEDPDQKQGLRRKYAVKRLKDKSGKHKNCKYFVLDLDHDKFARVALEAYAIACDEEFPLLAEDIRRQIEGMKSPT